MATDKCEFKIFQSKLNTEMNNLKTLLLAVLAGFSITVIAHGQITQEWVRSYSLPTNNSQVAADIVTDAGGNVYVTGYNAAGYSESDLVTVKYNSSGLYQWGKSYHNSVAYSHEKGKCIATYSSGGTNFVYAAGEVNYSGLTQYLILLKYDESGNQIWARGIYVVAYPFSHILKEMITDGAGNVYLTGGTSDKAFLVKVDSSGTTKVLRTFVNPSGYNTGQGNDIKLNGGKVYIGGQIRNSSSQVLPLLIICDTAGALLEFRYNQAIANSTDNESRIMMGNSGNVYMGFRTSNDYRLTKYSSNGDTLWNRKHNGTANAQDFFNALAVDANENIYMTGRVNGLYGDVGTVKFDSSGSFLWEQTYAGQGGFADEGKDVKIDGSGNVYVAGVVDNWVGGRSLMIKYNSSGTSLWVRSYDFAPNDYEESLVLAIDGAGNTIATGNCGYITESDYATIKYDPSGTALWARKYNSSQTSTDAVNSITTDKHGIVYAIGRLRVGQAGDNIQIVKYNSAGTLKWAYSRGGVGTDVEDAGFAIAVDRNGYVYYTGTMHTSFTGNKRDIYTGKLDSNGNNVWPHPFGQLYGAGGNDEGIELALDTSGNAVVGFNSEITAGNVKFGAVKYSPSGTALWTYGYAGSGTGLDSLKDMSVDTEGNVYLTGNSTSALSGINIVTIKISSAGAHQWTQTYNGSANADDGARSVDVDSYGNVYVTGSAQNSVTGKDIVLIKYSSSGSQLWATTVSNDNTEAESGVTVRYDSISEKVRLIGSSRQSIYNTTLFLADFDTAGVQTSGSLVNPSPYGSNYAIGGELDGVGKMISAQAYSSQNGGFDLTVWRGLEKQSVFNGSSSGNDIAAYNVPLATFGNFFYAGVTSFDSVKGNTFTIVKFRSPLNKVLLRMYIQGYYDSNTGNMIRGDTVRIQLRSSLPPYNTVDSAKVVLSFEGIAEPQFMNVVDGQQYYVSVNHRNSIETWSAAPAAFSQGLLEADFRDTSEVFGNNLTHITSGTYWQYTVFSGDVNQDGTVDATDAGAVDNDASNFESGYINTDVTGDEIVDASDALIIDNNAYSFVSMLRP